MTSSHRTGDDLPLLLILVVALLTMLVLDRPLARGDGLAYFVWLDSIAGDGDMDLANQARVFAHLNQYQVRWNEQTAHWTSDFPYGSALLLAPAYWLGRLVDNQGWLSVNPEHFISLQGRPLAYSLFPMLEVNLCALGAVALAYRCARFFVGPVPAAISSLFMFLGTPMLYYSTVEPFMAHVPATLLLALAFYLLLRARQDRRDLPMALAAGLVWGLATLVRWQMAVLVGALAVWLPLGRKWRATSLFIVGYCSVVWHLLYTWNWMFGRPLVVSATESGFLSWPRNLLPVLFSGGRGLFVWAPLTLLALPGWGVLARRQGAVAASLAAAFVLQALLNAGVADWWGGWAFGMRRMTELYPLFSVGLACLLAQVRPAWLRGGAWGLSVLALGFSLLLLLSHLNFVNTVHDRPQGDRALAEIGYQLTQSSFDITWQVFCEHYGPWAWSRPGP